MRGHRSAAVVLSTIAFSAVSLRRRARRRPGQESPTGRSSAGRERFRFRDEIPEDQAARPGRETEPPERRARDGPRGSPAVPQVNFQIAGPWRRVLRSAGQRAGWLSFTASLMREAHRDADLGCRSSQRLEVMRRQPRQSGAGGSATEAAVTGGCLSEHFSSAHRDGWRDAALHPASPEEAQGARFKQRTRVALMQTRANSPPRAGDVPARQSAAIIPASRSCRRNHSVARQDDARRQSSNFTRRITFRPCGHQAVAVRRLDGGGARAASSTSFLRLG